MHSCEQCGKEWPENYCPTCGRTIGKAARLAVPPPLPGPKPPLIPPQSNSNSAPAKKSIPWWAIITFAVLTAILAGGAFAYHVHQTLVFPPGYRNQPTAGWGVRKGEKEFEKANAHIDSFQGTNALGNSPERGSIEQNGVFVSMAALNALDALGDKTASVIAVIKAMPANGQVPDPRYSSYVPRLIEDLQGRFR